MVDYVRQKEFAPAGKCKVICADSEKLGVGKLFFILHLKIHVKRSDYTNPKTAAASGK